MVSQSQATGSKTFIRSLNLLLKSARLYGIDHVRCADQFRAVWSDLQGLLNMGEKSCLLGVAGKQLLADGAPVETSQAERSFVDMLHAAGLASIHFAANTTEEDLRRLVRAFASIGPKAESATELLQQALAGGDNSIQLNSVRYVPEDPSQSAAPAVSPLAVAALGGTVNLRDALDNPQKLLQWIAAAQGRENAAGVAGGGNREALRENVAGPATEDDSLNLLRTLASIARSGQGPADAPQAPVTQQLALLPAFSQELFHQALASLAASAPAKKLETPMLVQLAEHLAIRFALERFDRGDVRVNSIRDMLERSSKEIANLRKVLTGHEQALVKAGVTPESHADILDRQFWAAVPATGKRTVLLSPEAWCIPPRNVQQYVEELFKNNERDAAAGILLNYASCVGNEALHARRKAARGLVELARYFARLDARVLDTAIRCAGEQLSWEEDPETQEVLAAAYAKLAQMASATGNLASIQNALTWLEDAARERPGLETLLRPRLGVEDKMPDFVAQAMKEKELSPGLAGLFRRSPVAVADLLAARFSHCTRREECQRAAELFRVTGEEGLQHLRKILEQGAATQAAASVGLLSAAGFDKLERILIARISGWARAQQDAVVRQLAAAASPDRGRILARLFPLLDRMLLSEAIDEIGLAGDPASALFLLKLAAREMPLAEDSFLRAKAMEGLGRLRESRAEPLLREIATARQMWRWKHPEEMRIVALQALEKIDPEWVRSFAPQSDLKPADLALAPLDGSLETPWARQRRYSRVSLPASVGLVITTSRGDVPLESKLLSLGGGVTSAASGLDPGSPGSVAFKSGWRNVSAEVLFREAPRNHAAFEIVGIGLEERSRLRRLLSAAAA